MNKGALWPDGAPAKELRTVVTITLQQQVRSESPVRNHQSESDQDEVIIADSIVPQLMPPADLVVEIRNKMRQTALKQISDDVPFTIPPVEGEGFFLARAVKVAFADDQLHDELTEAAIYRITEWYDVMAQWIHKLRESIPDPNSGLAEAAIQDSRYAARIRNGDFDQPAPEASLPQEVGEQECMSGLSCEHEASISERRVRPRLSRVSGLFCA